MIDRKTILSSGALAADLAKKGLVLRPKPNTVVAELFESVSGVDLIGLPTAHSSDGKEDISDDTAFYEEYATYFESLSSGTPDSPSSHDKISDVFIDDISKFVIKHISFAKNIVKPVVMDYSEAVKRAMEVQGPITPYSDFMIEMVDLPDVVFEKRFNNELKAYKGKTPIKPNNKMTLESKTDDDIIGLLLFGDELIDSHLKAWALQMKEKDPGFFGNIWHCFFTSLENPNEDSKWLRYEDIMGMNIIDRSHYTLALYLLGNRLFNTVDETAKGLSVNAYTDSVAMIRDYGATLLEQSVEQAESYQKTMMVVLETDVSRRACKVYATTYKNWLDHGGSPELIYAVLLTGKRYYSQAMIDSNVDELRKAWSSYTTFHLTTEANLKFDQFKRILKHEFAQIMTGFSEEELAYTQEDTGYLTKAKAIFEKEVDGLKMTAMEDIYGTALILICRARFFYTDAESILTDINTAKLINPNISDVREAALIATIHYVVDYVADQIGLCRQ